jgi:hypothetical protein
MSGGSEVNAGRKNQLKASLLFLSILGSEAILAAI